MHSFPTIATAHTCYRTKFGIPRQSGLVDEGKGYLELLPPYNQPNTVRGLEEFSHIWVLFVFSENLRDGWKATVRPPRLGGDKRLGVFATRSPFRPAPIGLSAMKLDNIEIRPRGRILLHVSGVDLLDGTPVLDIKPYILCKKVVAADPRPAYQRIPGREYQCYLEDKEVVWVVGDNPLEATILRISRHKPQ